MHKRNFEKMKLNNTTSSDVLYVGKADYLIMILMQFDNLFYMRNESQKSKSGELFVRPNIFKLKHKIVKLNKMNLK